jgi:hypothetical protein
MSAEALWDVTNVWRVIFSYVFYTIFIKPEETTGILHPKQRPSYICTTPIYAKHLVKQLHHHLLMLLQGSIAPAPSWRAFLLLSKLESQILQQKALHDSTIFIYFYTKIRSPFLFYGFQKLSLNFWFSQQILHAT